MKTLSSMLLLSALLGTTQPAAADDMQVISELNAGYIAAFLNADVEWYRAHLAEDFHCTLPDGSIIGKEEFLAGTVPTTVQDFHAEDVIIRIIGDTAIIHARTPYRLPDGTKRVNRYTDVWVRQGGRWLAEAAHVSHAG